MRTFHDVASTLKEKISLLDLVAVLRKCILKFDVKALMLMCNTLKKFERLRILYHGNSDGEN